jgi:hypothetical protein
VGTNGQIVVGPNSEILAPARIKLGGGAAQVVPANYATDRRDPSPNPFVLDLYTEWYSASARAPSNGGSTAPPNGNNAIGTLSGMPGFSATNQRQVTLGSGAEVTLAGGSDYNFCSLKMNSDARFVIPATTTQPVRIFIDSSTRPGNPSFVPSGCPAFAGNVVDLASGAGFINQTGKASMLQLFVYGSATENIVFNASANFTGTLWAPRSSVVFNQGATVTGAIAARDIEFRNNSGQPGFIGDPDANNVTGRWDGSYKRSGWRECSPRGNTPGC